VIGLTPAHATGDICEYITATTVIEPQDPDAIGIDNFGAGTFECDMCLEALNATDEGE
jgi:hypothetical protein